MASPGKTPKSTATAKTARPVTLKHLAAALAEEHTTTAGEAISAIRRHKALKKGDEPHCGPWHSAS